MASDHRQVAALGRPFALGMLYDARQDQLLTDFTLWDKETIKKVSIRSLQRSSSYEPSASDSIETKASQLSADPSLILCVLSGLVEAAGSASYLNDHKQFKNQSRVVLQYKATAAYERMDLNHAEAKKLQVRDVIKNSRATHVVTGVLHGANAFFVFDSEKLDSSSLHSMETGMYSLVKKIPKLDPEGNAVRNLREEEKNIREKFTCKFYGDFILDRNPATFEEAADACRKLPGLLGDDGEKSVPVKVWLTPLKSLDSSAAQLKGDVSVGLIRKANNVLKGVREIQMRCNEAMEKEAVKTFPQIRKKLKSFQHLCEDYLETVQQTLQDKIPLIREGEEEEEEEWLENFLDEQERTPFSRKNLDMWLDYLDREMNVITSCLDIMKGIRIIPDESDLDRQVLGAEDVLCFVFTSIETRDSYMDQMDGYFNETPANVAPPARDQWFFSDEVFEDMKQKANMISETAKGLKSSSRFSFLIAALPSEEFRGATVHHYRNGVKKTEDFSRPPIYQVRNETEKQNLVWYSCDLTLDPETVNGNLILSAGDKKATCGSRQTYDTTEKRFDSYPQVLCSEGLTGRHYFEVVWSSEVSKELGIGLAYESIPRKGSGRNTGFGYNNVSWYFGANDSGLRAWHSRSKTWSSALPAGCNRVGVYLDWSGGTLSFYQVSSNTLTHLYTFESRFSAPLYPGFYIWNKKNFVTFSPV